jgi:hypothetical protein
MTFATNQAAVNKFKNNVLVGNICGEEGEREMDEGKT